MGPYTSLSNSIGRQNSIATLAGLAILFCISARDYLLSPLTNISLHLRSMGLKENLL